MEGRGEERDALCVAKISVWWDIENCPVPKEVKSEDIARNISSTLRKANMRGPISISAYGDTQFIKREVQEKLTNTGINLHHIPSGRKDASDKAILVDMILWALDNPPPAHILLISGDRDFSNALHKLHMKTYNIMLARPAGVSVSTSLLAAASSVWIWSSLANGDDATILRPILLENHSTMSFTASTGKSATTVTGRQAPDFPLISVENNQEIGKKSSMSEQNVENWPLELRDICREIKSISCSSISYSTQARSVQQQPSKVREIGSELQTLACSNAEASSEPTALKSPVKIPAFSKQVENLFVTVGQSMLPLPPAINNVKISAFCQERSTQNFPTGANFALNLDTKSRPLLASSDARPHLPCDVRTKPSPEMMPSLTSKVSSNRPCGLMPPSFPYQFPPVQPGSRPAEMYQMCLNAIFRAIGTLRLEMMVPTEDNLYACIRSREKQLEFSVFRETLAKAIEMRAIMVKIVEAGQTQCFLPLNGELWVCVDPDAENDYPLDIWKNFHAFLCSKEGKLSFSKSKTRYDAALILRSSGPARLRSMALAQLVNIIQMAITFKKWLKPHLTSWSPLRVVVEDSVPLGPPAGSVSVSQQSGINVSPTVSRAPDITRGGQAIKYQSQRIPERSSAVLKHLKSWLVYLLSTQTYQNGYELSKLQQDFELASKMRLDPNALGFPGIMELVESFSDLVQVEHRKDLCLISLVSKGPKLTDQILSSTHKVSLSENQNWFTQSECSKLLEVIAMNNLKGNQSLGSCEKSVNANVKEVAEKLRAWLSSLPMQSNGYKLTSLWESFKLANNFGSDLAFLGFSNIKDMFSQFADLIELNKSEGEWILFLTNPNSNRCGDLTVTNDP